MSDYVESHVSEEVFVELKKNRRSPTEFFDVEENLNGYNYRYAPGHVQNRPAFSRAVERVRECLSDIRGLEGWSYTGDRALLPKSCLPQETSPGSTLRSEGYRSKGESYDRAVELATELVADLKLRDVPSSELPYCDMAGRPSIVPFWERKSRLIWVYPMEVVMIEGMFAEPFIRTAVKKKTALFGWWANKFHGGYQRLRDACIQAKSVLSLDYSKFDQRVPAWLIYRAFSLLEECFDSDFLEEHRDEWEFVQRYFIHTPIRTVTGSEGPWSPVYVKRGGVPSGSWFTQTIDTIVNALMVFSFYEERGINCTLLTAVGDDNYSTADQWIDVDDVSSFMKEWYNMVVSPEKSNVVYDTWEGSHFLGCYLSGEGRPVRPLREVVTNLMNPERTPEDGEPPGLLAERVVSYAYETGGFDDKVYYFLLGLWKHLVTLHPDLEHHPSEWSEISLRYWRDVIKDRPPTLVSFPTIDQLALHA